MYSHARHWEFKSDNAPCLSFTSLNLIVNSPLKMIHISLNISYETLVLNHDKKFYLTSLSILIACLLENVWILKGDIT